MYTITKDGYVGFNEVYVGELFECAGGLFVRIYHDCHAFALSITAPTKPPMNDGRISKGHITPFELDCPVGKVILEGSFETSIQDEYIRGFDDGVEGRDCLAITHDYLEGFKRGRHIMKFNPSEFRQSTQDNT